MGVIDLYFVDNEVEVLLSTKGSRLRLFYIFLQIYPLSSGARPVLPMGVAPEAIAEIFWV
jgi:hypothetical protein